MKMKIKMWAIPLGWRLLMPLLLCAAVAAGAASAPPAAVPAVAAVAGHAPDAAGVEFFEKHIRPVLIERC